MHNIDITPSFLGQKNVDPISLRTGSHSIKNVENKGLFPELSRHQ